MWQKRLRWTTCASFVPRTVMVLYKEWIHYPMCHEPYSHGQERYCFLFRLWCWWKFPQIKNNDASFFTVFIH